MGCCNSRHQVAELPPGAPLNPSPDRPETFQDKYELGKVLGLGNFGIVKEATCRLSRRSFAVKMMIPPLSQDENERISARQNLRKEIEYLQRLGEHEHIVNLYERTDEGGCIYLVFEKMAGGSLMDYLDRQEDYDEIEMRKVCKTLIETVAYCHSKGIVHRDLKPANVLLERVNDVSSLRIADFGFAKEGRAGEKFYTYCGTPAFMAPEIVMERRRESGYCAKVDMWSLGVMVYNLLGRGYPFPVETIDELNNAIVNSEVRFDEDCWDNVSTTAKHFIAKLLTKSPSRRMSAKEALSDPWFKSDVKFEKTKHRSDITETTESTEPSTSFDLSEASFDRSTSRTASPETSPEKPHSPGASFEESILSEASSEVRFEKSVNVRMYESYHPKWTDQANTIILKILGIL